MAFDLSIKAHTLSGSINPIFKKSMAHLVRSMNCYYINLIEGHDTHPRDIDSALNQEYESMPGKRNLQLEARDHIHIEIQEPIKTLPTSGNIIGQIQIFYYGFIKNFVQGSLKNY